MLKLVVKLLFDFTYDTKLQFDQETHKKIWFARKVAHQNFQGHISISTTQMITFIISILQDSLVLKCMHSYGYRLLDRVLCA